MCGSSSMPRLLQPGPHALRMGLAVCPAEGKGSGGTCIKPSQRAHFSAGIELRLGFPKLGKHSLWFPTLEKPQSYRTGTHDSKNGRCVAELECLRSRGASVAMYPDELKAMLMGNSLIHDLRSSQTAFRDASKSCVVGAACNLVFSTSPLCYMK